MKKQEYDIGAGSIYAFNRIANYYFPSSTSQTLHQIFWPLSNNKKINPVAFQLDLPPNSKVHPVFHVSLLKSYHGPIPPPALSTLSEIASPTVLTPNAT